MITPAEIVQARRAVEADEQPTAHIPPVTEPAPTVGPAPADDDHRDDDGHPHARHRGHRHSARHPRYGWRLVDQPLPSGWWPAHTPRRVDADTAVIPAVDATQDGAR